MGNGDAKKLICKTHGHELRWRKADGGAYKVEGKKGKKNGTTVIAYSIKYILKKNVDLCRVRYQKKLR